MDTKAIVMWMSRRPPGACKNSFHTPQFSLGLLVLALILLELHVQIANDNRIRIFGGHQLVVAAAQTRQLAKRPSMSLRSWSMTSRSAPLESLDAPRSFSSLSQRSLNTHNSSASSLARRLSRSLSLHKSLSSFWGAHIVMPCSSAL